jgi:DNA polymerase-3 subunit alpha
MGMDAVALTDHGNLCGAVELYRECHSAGINPIIGYEAYVAPGSRMEREARRRGEAGFHLTLLARNRTGFRNLIKLASSAFLEGYYYVPRIDKEILAQHKEGLVCLSGCASSEFSEFILKDQMEEATELARWFARLFGKNFFVEIQNNGLEIQNQCATGAIRIANKLGLPLVATSDAHYLCQADSSAHDVLLCINTGKILSDENRIRYGSDQFYVRPPEEMYRCFPDHQDAVRRSQEIADSCHIDLDFKTRHFPVFEPPAKKTPEIYLRELCEQGAYDRYGRSLQTDVRERLKHELDIICRMGFASYFLIVWDFVRFARENGIPASARGSACGSLVSYVLKLSHVDPLEYDLLFERFLDPNRSEAPDIDIDLCKDGRDQVIGYVRQKYGERSVAQIATFSTLAARAAVKDVGRVLNIPLGRVTQITEMIPETLGITLDEALKQNPDLRQAYDSDTDIHRLLDIARKLEGTNRNAGTHAAGVVISDGPLSEHVPLQRVVRKGDSEGGRRDETVITTQWVMGDLEKVGLLKMDFLGLRTLTLLDNAVKLIAQTRGIQIELDRIPLDDPETFALLQRGDAKGVFQFESGGIRELLKRMRPDHILDLIACNALYRPGPLGGGMVDAYINRKHSREKPHYPHPVMEEILAETYGVMVYQEQVMRILNRLGGIELSSAYACIKAISKKKHEIIDQRRLEFLKGAQERGVDEAAAREIFDLITFFGGYGFNKSHSAAYALIGYQTAYLKSHFTAEFMAALLSSEIEDGNKRDIMVQHIEDARRLGVEVLPPNVNAGDVEFAVQDGRIVFGLTAVKGVGRAAAADIVRARKAQGPFADLYDFCERIDLKAVPRAAIEKLVMAGAFDCFGARRAQWWHVLSRALQAAGDLQEDRRTGQTNFLEVLGGGATEAARVVDALPDIPEWPDKEKLKNEKLALDFFFSSHPLAQHEEEFARLGLPSVAQVLQMHANQEATVAGMLTQVRFLNTKKARNGNSRYVRCKLEDFSGAIECLMWPDDFARFKDDFQEDRICVVKGTVERIREEPSLRLSRVLSLDRCRQELTRGLRVSLKLGVHGPNDIEQMVRIFERTPGNCPVYVCVRDAAGKKCVLKSGERIRVDATALPTDELELILGPGRVEFHGHLNGNGRNGK